MRNAPGPKMVHEGGLPCEAERNDHDPSRGAESSEQGTTQIDRIDGDFLIDAALIGDLLDIPAAEVPALMRNKSITSVCERGIDADEGLFRLNFFYGSRHIRLRVDAAGRVLHRSTIDFGERSPARGRQAEPKPAVRIAPFPSTS